MRRWLLRISIGIASLLVLLIAVVQIVLWTPLPRRILLQQIEQGLGLRISAASLSTGWLGKSELQDVSLGLPLSSGDFLKVKTLVIHHNTLIGLTLGRQFTIDSIEIDDPVVEVLQDPTGQWNLQQVAQLLARAGGSNSAQQPQATDTGVPKLPNVRLVNGSVHISDNQKHTLELKPLDVSGRSDGMLVWKYDATIADSVSLHGELAPGGNWRHRVTLAAQHLDPLLKGWGVPTAYSADLKASWIGQFADGKLTGTLSLDRATAQDVPTLGDVSAGGSVDVESANGVLTLRPNQVNLTTTNVTLPDLGIQSGSIVTDETGLHAQAVKLSALGGRANVDAALDPRTMAVDLRASWSGLSLAKQTSQSGSLTASLREPFANQPVIRVELDSNGTVGETDNAITPPNRWNAQLALTGQGSSWAAIDWVLAAPRLTYAAGTQTYDLSRSTAHITQRLPMVALTDLSLPVDNTAGRPSSANFVSNGNIDFSSTRWKFDATGGYSASYQNAPVPITLALHASGDKYRYELRQLAIGIAGTTVTADGSYDRRIPKPVDLHVQLAQQQRIVPDAPVQGEVSGKFSILGVLLTDQEKHFRPYLSIDGDLTSNDLVLLGRPVGDIDIKLQGTTATPMISRDEPGPIHTQISTTNCYLFEAPWSFTADYPDHDGALNIVLQTHGLPIEEVGRFAKIKGISGEVSSAKWTAKISSPDLAGVELQSEYHLIKPALGAFSADTIDANATLHDSVLQVNPLLARSGAGSLKTTASMDLKRPPELVTETTVDRWPYAISDSVVAQLSAHSALDVDLHSSQIRATGSLNATTDVLLTNAELAHLELDAGIRRRTIEIQQLRGNVLSGTFTGSAAMDLDKPLQATGRFVWQNIDLASCAKMFPAADGAGGIVSGALTLAPARDPRPLEPVRIDINLASFGGHYRSLRIGDGALLAMHAVAYANTDRLVLDHSDLLLGGGVLHFWGRVDDRGGRGISTLAVVDFQNLQLDELAHINPKISKPMPGVLSGRIGLVRSGPHANQLLGQAHINLTQTDLVNFGPLAKLYDVMNVGGGTSNKPNGSGSVDLAFEQNILRVTDFRFFNRGVDARGLFRVGPLNYDNFAKTPVGGQVVGTARLLKSSRVAVLSDFDTIYSALAGQLTTVNMSGSIENPKYVQATLADIGTAMKQLLVGDMEQNAE